jgi:hypothetical protein
MVREEGGKISKESDCAEMETLQTRGRQCLFVLALARRPAPPANRAHLAKRRLWCACAVARCGFVGASWGVNFYFQHFPLPRSQASHLLSQPTVRSDFHILHSRLPLPLSPSAEPRAQSAEPRPSPLAPRPFPGFPTSCAIHDPRGGPGPGPGAGGRGFGRRCFFAPIPRDLDPGGSWGGLGVVRGGGGGGKEAHEVQSAWTWTSKSNCLDLDFTRSPSPIRCRTLSWTWT